jgi:hypothetical protein
MGRNLEDSLKIFSFWGDLNLHGPYYRSILFEQVGKTNVNHQRAMLIMAKKARKLFGVLFSPKHCARPTPIGNPFSGLLNLNKKAIQMGFRFINDQ